MRRKIILFSCLLLSDAAIAQTKKPGSLGFSFGFTDFQTPADIESSSLNDVLKAKSGQM